MKRKISILSLVLFIASLITPINNVNAEKITDENSAIIMTEGIDNNEEADITKDESTQENTLDDIQEGEDLVQETNESVQPDNMSENEALLNSKYDKNYINNIKSQELYKLSNDSIEEINESLSPKAIIDNYEVLDTKTDDEYEIALAYGDGSYYFVGSSNSYEDAIQILENTPLPISEDSIIPVIINKNGQVVYSTNAMAYILNTSNATVNIYTTSSLSSAFTYVNQAYVSDIPLIESTSTAAKIQVSGYTGWVKSNLNNEALSDLRIVPMNQVKNPSYYISEGGILYHYISKDLIGTNGYKIAIGKAPSYLATNTRYFSYDGNYFYDGSNIESGLNTLINDLKAGNKNNAVNKNNPYYLYYQYLPLRSKTIYSATQLDNYINAKTKDNSKLRGIGQALKDAEEKYGVNALLILGVAINESGWGTSAIAQQKNNLFGIKAYDSNTGAADVFATPGDSVIEFAKNYMSKGYTNPSDWRHFGGLLGNKGVGANVKYASDPFWGEKAARYAFDADLYLSGNKVSSLIDTNRYKIGMYTTNNEVKNSSGSTIYKVDNNHGWIGATFAFANNDIVYVNGQAMYQIYPERNTPVSDNSYNGDYNWDSKGYVNTSGVKIISDGSNSNVIGIPSVVYSTHIQNVGWQSNKSNGQMSGTEGQALRLEGIRINLENYPGASIRYSTHIQNVGWQDWKYNGEVSGTEGKSLRLEGIKIEATNLPEGLEVQYRVHVQNEGWQEWKSSGEIAGTQGKSLRLEAIEIRIAEKTPTISYKCHVQYDGWQEFVSNGQMSGTEGRALRLEGIVIDTKNLPEGAYVRYRTHIQDIGWQSWKTDGQVSGTEGKSKRLEGIQIELIGAPGYHVEYRTHVQNEGWQNWKRDGEISGTTGKSLRLEGIEIRIVKD
ncbi:glucosaminidase domain-containing protein [Clostridium sp. D53t1_180928_C8]|uniref:glucosaminidase domain-containing protein n=1 Tax=Clostridium sp. D53t1_180928_C8 TaxID=2787101 RepID=UPI0018A9906F|nr:glucosaminidase domain-containing protein [Clostridium sp. D53t1_180928_C8]